MEETGYQNIIIVDNTPKVGPDRIQESKIWERLCLRIILMNRGISKGKWGVSVRGDFWVSVFKG